MDGETTGADGANQLSVPPKWRRGKRRNDDEWLRNAFRLIDLLARSFGQADLSTTSLLDVGCGTKFTAAIINHDLPIGRYVGVDTDADIVAFLGTSVHDPRFSFHHLDAHNDLYNPTGRPLESYDRLPIPDEKFGLISLFSVFTHLAPHDYRAMLKVLRPHIADDGRLLFSLFVDEGIDPSRQDAFSREVQRRAEAGDPAVLEAIAERQARGTDIPDFVDRLPDRPMMEAVYSERFARELIDGSGWRIEALHPPELPIIQHYFICRPD